MRNAERRKKRLLDQVDGLADEVSSLAEAIDGMEEVKTASASEIGKALAGMEHAVVQLREKKLDGRMPSPDGPSKKEEKAAK
jgi:hypothetical protein